MHYLGTHSLDQSFTEHKTIQGEKSQVFHVNDVSFYVVYMVTKIPKDLTSALNLLALSMLRTWKANLQTITLVRCFACRCDQGLSRQDSIQKLLWDRFPSSLLRGYSCCVHQCFPFILHKKCQATTKQCQAFTKRSMSLLSNDMYTV